MRSSYRQLRRARRTALPWTALACLALAASTLPGLSACAAHGRADANAEFTGYITDTECGPNHAPMIAKGGMGKDDRECTLICVKKGATFGFVDAARKRFYQLDDQDAPAAFAGQRVRVTGRLEGDTIYVRRIAAAGKD